MAKKPADVVILDVQLPDGNGLEIVGALRGAVERPLAIVALSADRIGNTAERAMEVGCDRFGLKPIPARDLLDLVVEALEERRTLRIASGGDPATAAAAPPRDTGPPGLPSVVGPGSAAPPTV